MRRASLEVVGNLNLRRRSLTVDSNSERPSEEDDNRPSYQRATAAQKQRLSFVGSGIFGTGRGSRRPTIDEGVMSGAQTPRESHENATSDLLRGLREKKQEYQTFVSQDWLKVVSLFQNCSAEFLRYLSEHVEFAMVESGKEIFHQGDPGDVMYLLINGKVEVEVSGVIAATLGNGSVFGEMAVMCKDPAAAKRSATVRTTEICSIRKISREKLMFAFRSFRADEMILEAECAKRLKELEDKGLVQKKNWWNMPVATEDSDSPSPVVSRRKTLWKRAGTMVSILGSMTKKSFSAAAVVDQEDASASKGETHESDASPSREAVSGEDIVKVGHDTASAKKYIRTGGDSDGSSSDDDEPRSTWHAGHQQESCRRHILPKLQTRGLSKQKDTEEPWHSAPTSPSKGSLPQASSPLHVQSARPVLPALRLENQEDGQSTQQGRSASSRSHAQMPSRSDNTSLTNAEASGTGESENPSGFSQSFPLVPVPIDLVTNALEKMRKDQRLPSEAWAKPVSGKRTVSKPEATSRHKSRHADRSATTPTTPALSQAPSAPSTPRVGDATPVSRQLVSRGVSGAQAPVWAIAAAQAAAMRVASKEAQEYLPKVDMRHLSRPTASSERKRPPRALRAEACSKTESQRGNDPKAAPTRTATWSSV